MAIVVTKLYCHVKQGTAFKPGSLVGDCAYRADYVTLPNGDAVGVVHATSARARLILEAVDGITVSPPLHQQLQQKHLDAFTDAGVKNGDTGYDLGDKLFAIHQMPWMNPENGPDY